MAVAASAPVEARGETGSGSEAPPGGGSSTPREAFGSGPAGIWRVTSIPGGSKFVADYPAPECDYVGEEDVLTPHLDGEPLTEAQIEEVIPEDRDRIEILPVPTEAVLTGGAYRYREVRVDREATDAGYVDEINATVGASSNPDGPAIAEAIGAIFTPIEEADRRFWIYCERPDGTLDRSQYPGWIDVPATDPAFGLNAHLTELYNFIDPAPMTIRQPEQVDNWTGLVVKSPAWLAVNAADWQTTPVAADSHLGWSTEMLATPTELRWFVEYRPTEPDAQNLAFTGWVPCIGADAAGDVLTPGDAVEKPAEPFDLAEWHEGGITSDCAWTPPARGDVTITAHVTYTITATTSLFGVVSAVPMPPYTEIAGSVTYYAGELRAVNVNSDS